MKKLDPNDPERYVDGSRRWFPGCTDRECVGCGAVYSAKLPEDPAGLCPECEPVVAAIIELNGNVVEVLSRIVEDCPDCGEHTLVTTNPWRYGEDYEPSTTECTECGYDPNDETDDDEDEE